MVLTIREPRQVILALHCIALHCIALHCIALHCIAHTLSPGERCLELLVCRI